MRICPKCRTAYPAKGRATCTKDGTRLVDAEEFAASKNDPLLGRMVAGRFHVRERIGVGGMGTVYRADQKGLDRPVALKVLKKELISDRETVTRFHREAKAMSMLVHANTVRVFDFGEDDDGYLFLAMELLEGELLTAWAEREVTPPIDEAVRAIQEILRSLNEAHSKGLIHRDLKPDNIYLARVEGHAQAVVKVLDFGIAKAFRGDRKIDQLETQAGTVFGTPRYMSPEQAQGKSLDHRSDLYSVGVLLYQLLTGRPPFLDDDAVVVMAKHIRDAPPALRELVPDQPIPRQLERVVMRALAKEPDDRFDNADAFEAALEACLPLIHEEAERHAEGRPSGFVDQVSALPRVPLAIGGALVVLSMVAAFVIVVASGPDEVAVADDLTTLPTESASPPSQMDVGPAETEILVESEPPGAALLDGEREVGRTPQSFTIRGDEVRTLTAQLDGHESASLVLAAGSAPTRRVTLVPVAQPTTETTPTPRRSGRRRGSSDESESPQETPTSSGDPYERFD